AFLIPFFIFLVTCGLPLFFLECSIGQFSGKGPLHVWTIAPLFAGVGMAMNIVSAMCAFYYNIIIAWALYYLGHVFTKRLPWTSCDNDWNTDNCYTVEDCHGYGLAGNDSLYSANGFNYSDNGFNYTTNGFIYTTYGFNDSASSYNASIALLNSTMSKCGKNGTGISAAEEFWKRSVLRISDGLEDMGTVQWEMMLCFFAAWLFIFLCLMKGVQTLGKVVYVTATLPYVLLTAILIRGVTLPDLNTFSTLRDSIFITFLGEGTSIYGGLAVFSVLGFMAKSRNTGIEDAFGMVEIICGSIVESYPKIFHKRRVLLTGLICAFFFILGLPLTMNGGIYVFQLFDWYSTSFGLPLIGVMECFVLGWIYGTDKLSDDIMTMIGRRPPLFMTICWKYITPTILAVALGFAFWGYTPPTYGDYEFPAFARGLGWCIGLVPILPIPVVMVVKIITTSGTFGERVKTLIKPSADWEPALKTDVLMADEARV
ncbi:hypothetical protein BaRGS_00004136, partial [Batillaria attramentaria]